MIIVKRNMTYIQIRNWDHFCIGTVTHTYSPENEFEDYSV